MHLKIPLLSRGLKFNFETRLYRVSACHSIVKWMTPVTFRHQAHSDACFLQLLNPRMNPCFTAGKANRGLRFSCNLRTAENDTVFTSYITVVNGILD